MGTRRTIRLLAVLALIAATSVQVGTASAAPSGATDESKVPHYFGPNPNWANSPFTLPDATVTIQGNGSGATAVATVGANGSITAIDVTNGGSGYGEAKVVITGSGTGATADAEIVRRGAVAAIDVVTPGVNYSAPTVTITGNGTGATATAYGGVSAVNVTNGGVGYTAPTVNFDLPDDPNGVQATGHIATLAADGRDGMVNGVIEPNGVVVDNGGSGYATPPGVAILNGTLTDPLPCFENGDPNGTPTQCVDAAAGTRLFISSIAVDTPGANYSKADVTIADPTGTGATATAQLQNGVISAITLKKGGSGYVLAGGIRKFVDTLPGLGPTAANNLGQYIPVGVPDTTTFPGADYYEIGVVDYTERMSSSLPASGTRLRGYVQLETSVVQGAHVTLPGTTRLGVDRPHYLGPTIVAQKNRPVRITFYNLLPTGAGGELSLPVDSTIMGSGMGNMGDDDRTIVPGGTVLDEARNPMCSEPGMSSMCFPQNRATLHLHGGNTPWISDGTAHQWITPANETTDWPQGVSVQSVPDMVGPDRPAGVDDCSAKDDGCSTFYYSNQQSARLMFYHDHAWGITRLNVYAGEAAGYVIQDPKEQSLVAGGILPNGNATLPLVIQDRTFVPDASQLYDQYNPDGTVKSYGQDPTWDASRWGGYGDLWFHHVYMPAQNPGDPSGMSAFGRWMYGPWFWPPAGDAKHGPIANPYFNKDPEGLDGLRGTGDDWGTDLATPCQLDDPSTWQYDTDPFCEPELIPGTPLISAGMEQFNDTPIVNGTAYPTVTLDPKSYRLRILNAANDRFWNLQWYLGDATTASTAVNGVGQPIGPTEVALNAAEVAAAQTDPVVFPTPDLAKSPAGPDWIQFGTEGGFLPAPAVVDGQQVTTWITDPTRFDVGNVDQHSLLLAPAERADVVVDFSKFAGKTLILYNDSPAAFPARIPSYDYYTGAPDLRPVGAPSILPGFGPNTRTIMQVKIRSGGAAKAFNLTALRTAFSHKANGSGAFEAGQHPIIVGQAAYNSAYGTSFAAGGWCDTPGATRKCDGFARINQQGGDPFTFDTLRMRADGTYPAGFGKVAVKIEPKAIHDETNASAFDEFGRMQANLGLEAVPATPGLQNVILHPFVYPGTEVIDTSKLPVAAQQVAGQYTDVKVTPIATGDDGTQIWKITHNGVDTHPIHFHAYDVQLVNRVTWDNIVMAPDATELGWKDTLRISPLQDTIVALRPVIPKVPFDLPNEVRLLSPMQSHTAWIANTTAAQAAALPMLAFAPNGEPIDILNHWVNFGAEYTYHCHILSHEEMDMMRPVSLALPPIAPSGLTLNGTTLSWNDNSLSETEFVVQRLPVGGTWSDVGTVRTLFDVDGAGPGAGGPTFPMPDPFGNKMNPNGYSLDVGTVTPGEQYRVIARNRVGDTWDYSDTNLNQIAAGTFTFPVTTVSSAPSEVLLVPAV